MQYAFFGALVLALLAASITLILGIQRRKHRERLLRLSRKYSLALLDGDARPAAVALASFQNGAPRRARLRDVLSGTDDDGLFYLALRQTHRRRKHHILFFELSQETRLRGFRIEPSGDCYQLSWRTAPAQWKAESVVAMSARVLFHVGRLVEDAESSQLIVELDGRRAFVQATGHLKGSELERFVADATRMRRRLVGSQRASRRPDKTPGALDSRSLVTA